MFFRSNASTALFDVNLQEENASFLTMHSTIRLGKTGVDVIV
jgi:hypothetical protein